MVVSAGSLKEVLSSIFRRKGGDGLYTYPFDGVHPSLSKLWLATINLRSKELPVIGSLRNPNNWLILTTERLMWAVTGNRHELPIECIWDANLDWNLIGNFRSKEEIDTLDVITIAGDKHTITVEGGAPLFGFWNVLKNLGTRNRHAKEREVEELKGPG
jgi:hypothetical protein